MSKKAGKQTPISDLLKREICAFQTDNLLRIQTEIAAHFNAKYGLNIDRTTIRLHVEGGSKTAFKHRRVKFPLLEEAISVWVDQMTSKGAILTEALV